jgi:thymidylate synthase
MYKVEDIRNKFIELKNDITVAEDGNIELINISFVADEEAIFGKLDENYAIAEVNWYMLQSLNINDIPYKIPKIWKKIATESGQINSNYGWCIFSKENFSQYANCIEEIKYNKFSRRACMIYNRPNMHSDYCSDGMDDFICTYSTQLLIRDNKLHYLVYMRSNDAVFGYKNDRYWHNFIFDCALRNLQAKYKDLQKGELYWNAASLHIYPRHFKLIK